MNSWVYLKLVSLSNFIAESQRRAEESPQDSQWSSLNLSFSSQLPEIWGLYPLTLRGPHDFHNSLLRVKN